VLIDKLKNCFNDIKKGNASYWIYGLTPEGKSYLVSLLREEVEGFFLFITPQDAQAENLYGDLCTFLCQKEKMFLLSSRRKGSEGAHLRILHQLRKEKNILIVASLTAIYQKVPSFSAFNKDIFCLRKGAKASRDTLLKSLAERGYEPCPLVEEVGECAYRGGIIDFYSPLYFHPIRIEFLGEKIESIREFDPLTQSSVKKREKVLVSSRNEIFSTRKSGENLSPFFRVITPSLIILDEPGGIQRQMEEKNCQKAATLKCFLKSASLCLSGFSGKVSWAISKRPLSLSFSSLTSYQGHFDLLIEDIKSWIKKEYKIILLTPSPGQGQRLKELLQEKGIEAALKEKFFLVEDSSFLSIVIGDLRKGFIFKEAKQVFVTDEDIFKRYRERRQRWSSQEEKRIKRWTELKEEDYVVHIDYGVGKFKGIETLLIDRKKNDYFRVDYKGTDRLFIPIHQLDRLHKYAGSSDCPPPVYSLEGGRWRWIKQKVRKATRELASSLLRLYSIRKTISGRSFSPDTEWQLEFESSFPYEETPDQLKTTQEIKQNMESPTPMDRLICGDAGYGKTEVAIRAAFKAVMDNEQVAILVPTTILAEQHYRTFKERMAAYPIYIEVLSRFQALSKQKDIIMGLKEGRIDVVIGTHRLIQRDIHFKDLGLVIIDEEQRFGVLQKEKLREMEKSVDVLSLSATPIPRSLYMSLVGVREMSMISTPPPERQNVEIEVTEYNETLIKRMILNELERNGQVFYLYNRIKDIYKVAQKIKRIVPYSCIAVSHGRMPSKKLEVIIRDFLKKRYNILVCTTIIESGIDMPNVNTLIVENAEQFGLAELYQLRGRVGRGKEKGYVYFFPTPNKPLTDEARRRLEVINQFRDTKAGFHIAMQDLEIRGAGNLLGREQHGHIGAVGFTLYTQLLSEEVKRLRGKKISQSLPLSLDLEVEARIPSFYVPYQKQRFELYRKAGKIEKEEEVFEFKEELRDRYGLLPRQVRNLISLLRIGLMTKKLGIISLRSRNSKVWVTFSPFAPLDQEKRNKIKEKLWPEVQPFPLDEKNLLIIKKGREEESLISLIEILQELKDVIYSKIP